MCFIYKPETPPPYHFICILRKFRVRVVLWTTVNIILSPTSKTVILGQWFDWGDSLLFLPEEQNSSSLLISLSRVWEFRTLHSAEDRMQDFRPSPVCWAAVTRQTLCLLILVKQLHWADCSYSSLFHLWVTMSRDSREKPLLLSGSKLSE